MADINSPQDYLNELLGIVDSLSADRAEQAALSSQKKELEAKLKSLEKTIAREKNDTVSSRRADLEAGYEKQLRTANDALKAAGDKRQKALNKRMAEKTEEATKDQKSQNKDLKETLRRYVKDRKLPGILTSRAYYALFCPGVVGYVALLALFLILIFLSIGVLLAHSSTYMLGLMSTTVLVLFFFAYILIWANTRVKYRDEINACRQLMTQLKAGEKQVKAVSRSIQKAGDDSSYDLSSFDEELAGKKQDYDSLDLRKKQALVQFDQSTAGELKGGIDSKYAEQLSALNASVSANAEACSQVRERINEAESRLNSEFVSYVGTKNLTHDRITELIKMIDEGGASTVPEAVSKLSTGTGKK